MLDMNKESLASFASIVVNILIGEYFAETHSAIMSESGFEENQELSFHDQPCGSQVSRSTL